MNVNLKRGDYLCHLDFCGHQAIKVLNKIVFGERGGQINVLLKAAFTFSICVSGPHRKRMKAKSLLPELAWEFAQNNLS